mmetsp:Transcript_33504/g.78987  ORF Transcript_33504/g.78987 Transcript_33504/m.78987 type:complete len:574 (+) Transcript_33504:102-1823(+)
MAMMGDTGGKIAIAELPRDLPGQSENHFIVVVCDSNEMKWSFHDGAKLSYVPTVFWTTPHLEPDDHAAKPSVSLSRFLCPHALTHLFGVEDPNFATKQNAARTAAKRKVPFTTVYVMWNNEQNGKDISFLFSEVPTRLFRLSSTDFFNVEQLGERREPLMSAGQIAAMYAAKKEHESPVLLMNGGHAITYIGMDKESNFLGGGACAAMPIRCRTLCDYCSSNFPSVDFLKYKQITEKAKKDKKPISLFSTDMEVSVAANATAEMAGQLRNIVKQFLKLVGPLATPVTVIINGDDTGVVKELLSENCSNVVEAEPDVAFPASSKFNIVVRKNMIAYGIQALLAENKKKQAPDNPDDEIREALIGLRGAQVKKFNGKTEVYRGSIVKIVRGKMFEEDTFILKLDNGEDIYLDLTKLYDSLSLYKEVSEEDKEENKEDWVGEKREALTKVQANLEGKNDQIKKRKIELEIGKQEDGSIVNTLARSKQEKRGAKRQRSEKEDNPKKYIGQRIAKYFPEDDDSETMYFGTIDRYSSKSSLWHVMYDDDDQEEFDKDEIRAGILLYAKNKDGDKKNRSD